MSLPRYPEYKDSGVSWLGEIPSHWRVQRLKYACTVFPSNVDKHSRDEEPAVRLCNYTDVYYNERITSAMPFMEATASEDQIAKFTLKAGDTIITKDSETADDIAIAAYVPDDLPGVVCGYHLSMVRPRAGTAGAFVKRLFDSVYVKARFAVAANGLTRVGLGQYALDNVELPFPPYDEQTAIATFLDRETAKIDALIEEQEKLLTLLAEKRQATISHAVTKGLNPDVPMKDSGVEWLGEVPAHWEVVSLKHLVSAPIIDGPHETPVKKNEGIPFVSAEALSKGFVDFNKIWGHISEEDQARYSKRYSPKRGDILIVKLGATAGTAAMVETDEEFNIWVPLAAIRLKEEATPEFVCNVLKSSNLKRAYELNWTYGTQQTLGLGTIANLHIPLPPIQEQREIVSHFGSIFPLLETLIEDAANLIKLLKERRSALISAAVTGKIDVRGLVPAQKPTPELEVA